MKKQLTQNISRYDEKMVLRLDGRTAIAALIALLCGAAIGFPLGLIDYVLGLTVGVVIFGITFVLKIGLVGGVPLLKFIPAVFKSNSRREYLHTGTERFTFGKGEKDNNGKKEK